MLQPICEKGTDNGVAWSVEDTRLFSMVQLRGLLTMKKHTTTLWHQVIAGKFNIVRVKCYTGENAIPALPAGRSPRGCSHTVL